MGQGRGRIHGTRQREDSWDKAEGSHLGVLTWASHLGVPTRKGITPRSAYLCMAGRVVYLALHKKQQGNLVVEFAHLGAESAGGGQEEDEGGVSKRFI